MVPKESIWKFRLELKAVQVIEMPKDAKILHLGLQQGEPYLWAQVFTDAVKRERAFRIYGTGDLIDWVENPVYVGTFQQPPFVWHLYEINT